MASHFNSFLWSVPLSGGGVMHLCTQCQSDECRERPAARFEPWETRKAKEGDFCDGCESVHDGHVWGLWE